MLELSRRQFTGTRLAEERGDFIGADAAAEAEGHVRQILHGFRRRDAADWRVRRGAPNLNANRAQRTQKREQRDREGIRPHRDSGLDALCESTTRRSDKGFVPYA